MRRRGPGARCGAGRPPRPAGVRRALGAAAERAGLGHLTEGALSVLGATPAAARPRIAYVAQE
ncbi:ABC transporter ATP-binding protein, partial [Streptomyces sp. NPDC002454]